jgi:hypothetical protein
MRGRHFLVPGAGLVFAALFLPPASGSSPDAGPTLTGPSVFRYVAPPGWTSQVGPSSMGGFPQAIGPASHNFTPDITFKTDGYEPVAQFVQAYQPTLIDVVAQVFPLKLVDQEPFVTAAGVQGVRLHSIDPSSPPTAEQFSYIFSDRNGLIYEFACACAPADSARYAPIFDASMKTVVILQAGG